MGNVTTPIKGALAAYVAHLMVSKLGMEEAASQQVADAAWLVLTAAIAYAVPATFANKTMTAVVTWILARVLKVAPVLVAVSLGGTLLVGCSAQQAGTHPPRPPRDLNRDCRIAEIVANGALPILTAKCSQAKDPLTDGYCLAIVGTTTAIAACYEAAGGGDAAAVDENLERLPDPPASVDPFATTPDPVPPVVAG